jgi:transposase InsO family protein
MNIHKNARLTPLRREEMALAVLSGRLSRSTASRVYGVTPKIVSRWTSRFKAEGRAGVQDRSSRPHTLPQATDKAVVDRAVALRRERLTGRHVARQLGLSTATVSRIFKRAGLSRLRDLQPAETVQRYQHAHPGELIHIDIKRLGRFDRAGHRITGQRNGEHRSPRGIGWEYVHVCVDDASRIAVTDIFPDERAVSAIVFLRACIDRYRDLGVEVKRIMTDNGPCYASRAFAAACKALGLKHTRTRPYTPRTNGKAERFIQTALREWAYARRYESSEHRKRQLPAWTHMYNWHRPHRAIKDQTPISKVKTGDNLLIAHI